MYNNEVYGFHRGNKAIKSRIRKKKSGWFQTSLWQHSVLGDKEAIPTSSRKKNVTQEFYSLSNFFRIKATNIFEHEKLIRDYNFHKFFLKKLMKQDLHKMRSQDEI